MLTDLHIAVIGGDARQLEVIRKLIQLDAKTSLIGFDQLDHGFTGATKYQIEEWIFQMLTPSSFPCLEQITKGK